jgi:hypothetical protein
VIIIFGSVLAIDSRSGEVPMNQIGSREWYNMRGVAFDL